MKDKKYYLKLKRRYIKLNNTEGINAMNEVLAKYYPDKQTKIGEFNRRRKRI